MTDPIPPGGLRPSSSRRAGVLLHPSSLPGPYGVGEIGPAARELLAWLEASGQRVWQILPLTPVDDGGCPYASPSAFAHEPLLLSTDDLVADGFLDAKDKPYAPGRQGRVDWPAVRERKAASLRLAADRVRATVDLAAWEQGVPRLATWALYRAIGRERGGLWPEWPEALRDRDPQALAAARDRLDDDVQRELALQWLFDRQWGRLREEARARGIEIWGDVPIFVGWIAADVWERPELWRLGADRRPVVVSGVPPDAFSPDGQLWGHPLYDEPAHAAAGYDWWIARLGRALEAADRVRIDHFRGIEAVWEVAAAASHARDGHWVPGGRAGMLDALRAVFPSMPFVAEDLGVITDEVKALRDGYGLPGMAILQFAFDGDEHAPGRDHHPYLPHRHRRDQVVYTGTHDNDTALGWFRGTDEGTRGHARRYLGVSDADWPWALLRAAWRSVADTAIVPMQDLLGLGSDARMNVPGTVSPASRATPGIARNWAWRVPAEALSIVLSDRIRAEVKLSGRAAP